MGSSRISMKTCPLCSIFTLCEDLNVDEHAKCPRRTGESCAVKSLYLVREALHQGICAAVKRILFTETKCWSLSSNAELRLETFWHAAIR